MKYLPIVEKLIAQVENLLAVAELNQDDLEPYTREAIHKAKETLAQITGDNHAPHS